MRADDALLEAPPPDIGPGAAAEVAAEGWGLTGRLGPLTSERDRNYRLTTPDGRRFVLKFSNPAEDRAVTNLQTEALRHIARRDPAAKVQRILPDRDGAAERLTPLADGRVSVTRVLSWVEGAPMSSGPVTPALRVEAGRAAGGIARALADMTHPGADHDLLWDMRQAGRLRGWTSAIAEPALRDEVTARLDRFDADLSPRLDALSRQIVHNDLNPHNVMVAEGAVSGVIDFGDMVRTARAADAAIGASYFLADAGLEGPAEFLAGYRAACPLGADEVALMPDLIAMRMVTTLVIASWRAALQPANAAYILRNVPAQREGLAMLDAAGSARLASILGARLTGEGTT